MLQCSKGNYSKSVNAKLWFLHSAHRLMLIDICKQIHENCLNGFQVIVLTRYGHNFVTDKVPKAITQKALMQELQFLNSACQLILVDICMKIA